MFNILLVSYLGHVISREGVSTDPEKTADSSVHYARFMTSECSIGLGDGGDDSPPEETIPRRSWESTTSASQTSCPALSLSSASLLLFLWVYS